MVEIGLTNAACLWMVAGIGMAFGIGFYWPASIVTAVAMFNLVYLKQIARFVRKDRKLNEWREYARFTTGLIGIVNPVGAVLIFVSLTANQPRRGWTASAGF